MQLTDYSQPTPIVSQALATVKPGRVLDIGSYEGRNSLYLAHLGWEVTAIDTDKAALALLQKTADEEGLSLTTVTADMRGYKPTMTFDVVLALMVLHFIPEKDIASSITRIQDWTNPGGINVITAFTADNPANTRPYLFPTNSLRLAYEGWDIKNYEESFSSWVIPEGKTDPERYMVARLVAERTLVVSVSG